MAREAFPVVFEGNEEYAELALATGFPWSPGGAFKASESPLHPEVMKAVADDPILKIFAGPDGQFITSNSGTGMLVEDDRFPGLVIASASSAHNAKGKSTDDLDGFLAEVAETVQSLRRLIAGEEVVVLWVAAFDGLSFRSDARVETPWGWLRPATDLEAATTPMHLAPTVVLVLERPARFFIGDRDDISGLKEAQGRMQRASELLPLAALLGIEREERISLGPVWSTHVEPLLMSGFGVPP